MAVHRIKKTKEQIEAQKRRVTPDKPVSDAAMEQLARIMNDSPTIIKLFDTEWKITGLKPAVQWLIAEEACNVIKGENFSMGDVLKEFATNLPAVVNVITLALLNDKKRLFKNYATKEYSEEYYKVRDTLLWGDFKVRDWAMLLGEILQLIDVNFFFESTNVIKTVREMTLTRKTTIAEAE